MSRRVLLSVFSVLSTLGVGLALTSSASAGGAASAGELSLCEYKDFSVEITQGPSKGTKINGDLRFVVSQPDGGLEGALKTADGKSWAVLGKATSRQISLTIQTAKGVVNGLGQTGNQLCKKGVDLRGVAVGPVVSSSDKLPETDVGHWLASTAIRVDFNRQLTLADLTDTSLVFGGVEETLYSKKPPGGGVEIPPESLEKCRNAQTQALSTDCLQRFCDAQQLGSVASDADSATIFCEQKQPLKQQQKE